MCAYVFICVSNWLLVPLGSENTCLWAELSILHFTFQILFMRQYAK